MTDLIVSDKRYTRGQSAEVTHGASAVGLRTVNGQFAGGQRMYTLHLSVQEARDLAVILEYHALMLEQEVGTT